MSIDPIQHKKILLMILTDIYSSAPIEQYLGFKGGTAAMMCYGLDRVSVDLDFDILDETKEDIIFLTVKNILAGYGTLKEARKKYFTLFYLLSYDNKLKGAQNAKIEISRRNENYRYEVEHYMGISMKVMSREDMFANKLMAMHERMARATRDIYDVWFFFRHDWPINKQLVASKSGISYPEFLSRCIAKLENFDNTFILAGLGELLTEKQKAWARVNLKKDALFQLRLALEMEKEVV